MIDSLMQCPDTVFAKAVNAIGTTYYAEGYRLLDRYLEIKKKLFIMTQAHNRCFYCGN